MDISKRLFSRNGKNFFSIDGMIDSKIRISTCDHQSSLFFSLKMIEHIKGPDGKLLKLKSGAYQEKISYILINYALDDVNIRLNKFYKSDYVIVQGSLNSMSKSIIDNKCYFRKLTAFSITNVTRIIAA